MTLIGSQFGNGDACPPWARLFPDLVSLSEMLPFLASAFATLIEQLQQIEIEATNARNAGRRDHVVPQRFIEERIQGWFKYAVLNCDDLGLGFAKSRLEQFSADTRQPITFDDLRNHVVVLRQAIHAELRDRRFARIPKEKAQLLDRVGLDWAKIWASFPSTEKHAHQGTEAYALGLDEACVYHMMMALEPGLAALAGAVKVKYSRRTWANIIDDVGDKIVAASTAKGRSPPGSRAPTASAAARRRNDLTLFATAAKEFTYFREAWRNHMAHGRAEYDENDALKVLSHVREFMATLAPRLKERTRRI
jgi:hypothetical protein